MFPMDPLPSMSQDPRNMMGMALRALEFCLHCLDASPWPFLLEEVLQNYALAVEARDENTHPKKWGGFLKGDPQSSPWLFQ